MRIENTKAVVEKLFGKTHEESCKQFGLNVLMEERYAKAYPFGITVTEDGYGYKVNMGFGHYVCLLTFNLESYPSCCGTRLFHTFKVDPRITQEQVNEIMNAFINENKYRTDHVESSQWLGRSNRLEVMMVERRNVVGRDPLQDVEPVDNPRIDYKTLWNFFHKYAKRVRTRLEVNANTGNVLHNMEVIF